MNLKKKSKKINKKKFWKKFYKVKKPPLKNSNFSEFCFKYLKNYEGNIYDLGCGNGRDTKFFLKNKLNCYGIDQIKIIINKNKKKYIRYKNNFLNKNFSKLNFDKLSNKRYSIYSRFSLHSINDLEEKEFIKNLSKSKKLDLIMIETRTIYDDFYGLGKKISNLEYFSDHYRRFIDPSKIKKKFNKKFKIIYFKLGKNLAKFKKENPKVLRMVIKNERQKLPHCY